jgi:hypothetical protein
VHPRTLADLDDLEKGEWFHAVGAKDTDTAIVLSSWGEAIEHCGSVGWENLLLEAANQYRERLRERSRERLAKWNQVVDEIKPVTEALVRRKVRAVCSKHELPKVFEDTVRWDILHLCMEAEYAAVYPPGFYAGQAYWYVKGHFPCGWQGEFPQGKRIVY